MRVCQNALIYRFTPVTDSCNRGKFLKKGVLTQPHKFYGSVVILWGQDTTLSLNIYSFPYCSE
ncbi:hypothetical protein E5353_13575 [Bacteroides caecimuris]|uniref:Uncharacterized protein n=1 Tax=Bacteroides caecimuris TaxID=1796613 RepID=A0A4S2CR28_9BACE|nr:hypothetical protein E5353_13575 [Bacteroides caecimuris]